MSRRFGVARQVARAERLRRVLDDGEVAASGDLQQGVHLRALAEQVHRQQGPGLGRQRRLHPLGIEVEGLGVDVGEARARADLVGAGGGGEERERAGQHLVARADLQRSEGQDQGVGARGAADRGAGAGVSGDFLFEPGDLFTEDELLRVDHSLQRPSDLVPQRFELGLEVEQRNRFQIASPAHAGARAGL